MSFYKHNHEKRYVDHMNQCAPCVWNAYKPDITTENGIPLRLLDNTTIICYITSSLDLY